MADTLTSVFSLTKPGNLDAAGAGLWGPKLNTDFDLIDAALARPQVPFNSPAYGATTTLDLNLGRVFVYTVAAIPSTIAITNVPAATFCARILVFITNGGLFAQTWPASVIWQPGSAPLSGSAPTLRASGTDILELITKDAGVTWAGTRWGAQMIKRHTRATNSANQNFAAAGLTLSWDTNDASDVGTLHQTGVNPTRIQIPTGWEGGGLHLVGNITLTGMVAPHSCSLAIRKNGATTVGFAMTEKMESAAMGTQCVAYEPAPIVTDYWELIATLSSFIGGESITNAAFTSFAAYQVY